MEGGRNVGADAMGEKTRRGGTRRAGEGNDNAQREKNKGKSVRSWRVTGGRVVGVVVLLSLLLVPIDATGVECTTAMIANRTQHV